MFSKKEVDSKESCLEKLEEEMEELKEAEVDAVDAAEGLFDSLGETTKTSAVGPEIEILDKVKVSKEDYVPEDRIKLPVGILSRGDNYRYISIDEMGGVDDHLLDSSKARKNDAVGTSLVLGRCIQEVEGLLTAKKDPATQYDASLPKAMTQVDRDFTLIKIQMLAGIREVQMAGSCPRCQTPIEEYIDIEELPVIYWPEDKPRYLEFDLPKGIIATHNKEKVVCKKGKLRFPVGADQEKIGEIPSMPGQIDALFAACIFDLEPVGTINQAIAKNMKGQDRRYLMNLIGEQLPGLRQWKEVTCKCKKQFKISLDITSFFSSRTKSSVVG